MKNSTQVSRRLNSIWRTEWCLGVRKLFNFYNFVVCVRMDMPSNVVVDEIGELASILMDGSDRFGVSTVLFDSHEELIWVGNEGVSLQTLYSFSRI